jgi:hypothetical protein
MTRYDRLYQAISTLEANHKEPEFIPSKYNFPFPTMYPSQGEILEQAQSVDSFLLSSHTGWGKSPVFLALTRGVASIVIEPRIFLQTQVASYFKDYPLFGRSQYPCPHAFNAASAPCLLKDDCGSTTCRETCKTKTKTCMAKECTVFESKGEWHKYPCNDCEYITAQKEAQRVLRANGTVVCNFGNFFPLLRNSKLVVIDEADLFFKSINNAMKLKYSVPKKNPNDTIKELLQREVRGLQAASKDKNPGLRYKATNVLYSAQFLLSNHDLCYVYQKKDSFFIEIDPRNVNILSKKLFKDQRVIIVSATPGAFDLPSFSAEIHQRCGIFFAPVGNMTSKSLASNPYLMGSAAKAITEISDYFEMVYDNEHVIIHTSNLSTHAVGIFKCLGEDNCTMHTAGKLAETVSDYLLSGKRYLIVASAEQGLDASWSKLQFILKHPFPNMDEQARTLQRLMGPDFSAYYEGSARTRVIQTSGRVGRGFNDFGVTICLDSKTREDYMKNKKMFPEWFRNRVDEQIY